MARWVAIFDDEPGAGWVRGEHSAEHFGYLERHQDKIVLGGGLRPAPEQWWVGGLRVMEVESRDEGVRLCEEDPCFRKGLRKGYRLHARGNAPCYGPVEL
jgi:hypothetical protein